MNKLPFEPRCAARRVVGGLLPLGIACAAVGASAMPLFASPPAATTLAGQVSAATGSSADLLTAIRAVNQEVSPAVVQITNQQQVQTGQFSQPFVVPAGVGSGFIYDNQGHVLTNNHVIQGAQQILVSLPDKRSFPGKVVGADPQTDLAVVQVQGDNLPVAQLGDSSQLQVGDWVVSIGNALALPGGPTVTQGVVSALGRTVQEPGSQAGNQALPRRRRQRTRQRVGADTHLVSQAAQPRGPSCLTWCRRTRPSIQATRADPWPTCRAR